MDYKIWWTIFIFVSITQNILSEDNLAKKIHLTVGQSQEISIPIDRQIKLSRRGIVDIHHIRNERWSLTALKEGFVLIKDIDSENDPIAPFSIWVTKKHKQTVQSFFPAWMCSTQYIKCDHKNQTISGNMNNSYKFYKSKKWCDNKKKCFFETTLSFQGKKHIKDTLKPFLPQHSKIMVFFHGEVMISLFCNDTNATYKKKIHTTFKKLFDSIQCFVKCIDQEKTRQYKISAKIFVTEDSYSHQKGFDTRFNTQLSTSEVFRPHLTTQLKSLLNSAKTEIIGEPFVVASSGQKSLIVTGSEFPARVTALTNNAKHPFRVSWKEYGLSLQSRVYPLGKNKVKVYYNFSLKTPGLSENIKSLKMNKVQSKLVLTLSSPKILGGVTYDIKKNSESSFDFVRQIPVIAPFFKLKDQKKTHVYMYLCLQVDELT